MRVTVIGRVQGVGYRAWVKREAVAKGLSGWVRNRLDGSVEAVFSGLADAVEAMTMACQQGPRHAQVTTVNATPATDHFPAGFSIRPTK